MSLTGPQWDPLVYMNVCRYLSRVDMANFRLVCREITRKLGQTWLGAVSWSIRALPSALLIKMPEKYIPHIRRVAIGHNDEISDIEVKFLYFTFKNMTQFTIYNYIGPASELTEIHSLYKLDFHSSTPNEYQTLSSLPRTLKKLQLNEYFNQSLDGLPPNLITLRLAGLYYKSLSCLPQSLQHLDIFTRYVYVQLDELSGLTHLKSLYISVFQGSLHTLPRGLKIFSVSCMKNVSLYGLPPTLEELYLYESMDDYGVDSFDQPLDNLPRTLRILDIDSSAMKPAVDYSVLSWIPKVRIGHGFNDVLYVNNWHV
jgi:hypothetical protein